MPHKKYSKLKNEEIVEQKIEKSISSTVPNLPHKRHRNINDEEIIETKVEKVIQPFQDNYIPAISPKLDNSQMYNYPPYEFQENQIYRSEYNYNNYQRKDYNNQEVDLFDLNNLTTRKKKKINSDDSSEVSYSNSQDNSSSFGVFFALFWKILALISYLALPRILLNMGLVYQTIILFSALDFWTVKNISGRFLIILY